MEGFQSTYDRTAWQIVNAIAAGTKYVSLTEVAKTLGVNVNHLYHGKKRWTSWLNYDYEDDGPARCLQDITEVVHGNAWPEEWVEFIQDGWQSGEVTRKGKCAKDYCVDPNP